MNIADMELTPEQQVVCDAMQKDLASYFNRFAGKKPDMEEIAQTMNDVVDEMDLPSSGVLQDPEMFKFEIDAIDDRVINYSLSLSMVDARAMGYHEEVAKKEQEILDKEFGEGNDGGIEIPGYGYFGRFTLEKEE